MSESKFKGVVVPIVTPLTPQESVDVTSLRRLVNYLIDNGIHGIWAAGTTGEFGALSNDQRLLAIETVVDEARGRIPVVANISAAGTRAVIEIASALQQSGVDGIAATPPYYYDQQELLAHYRSVHEASSIPLWVYNIPSTVKLTVEAETIARLAGEGTVVGIKDSSGAGENLAQLVVLCRQRGIQMCRLLGSMYRVTMTRAIGAHGVVPGIANLAAASPHFSSLVYCAAAIIRPGCVTLGRPPRRTVKVRLRWPRSQATYCQSTTAVASVASLARTALAAPRYDKR